MRIVCLNGWEDGRTRNWGGKLALAEPDILCLQEVTHTPAADKGWPTYRDGDHALPQRANFYRDVCDALPDNQAFFCPAARGELWDDGIPVPSYWGLATFVRRSCPVIGQVRGFVHKDFSANGFGDHPRSRNAHGIRVHDDTLDRPFSITHMHGLRDPRGKMDTPDRDLQGQRLFELASQVSKPGELAVICGDFNVGPESTTLTRLRQAGFIELVTDRGCAGTRTSHYPKPGRFADYMPVNRKDALGMFDVILEPEMSDHCPLVLELQDY